MAMVLPRDAYVKINDDRLTDHNRSPVEQGFERIESSVRTARGRMRRSYVDSKRTFSISWSELPGPSSATIDGHGGADAIMLLHELLGGTDIDLKLTTPSDGETAYRVVFTDFSYSVLYRYDHYYYDISMTLEEV